RCAPATRGPATIVSSTTTTTVPSGPCDFNSSDRKCEGTCGDGGHCSAVAAGGACECRTTPCGDADAPSCDGFCTPDEACVFTVTDCSCVSIPVTRSFACAEATLQDHVIKKGEVHASCGRSRRQSQMG